MKPDAIRERLRSALQSGLTETARTIGELAAALPSLLAAVLEDPDETCASVSFQHTLGFEKYVLVNGLPDFVLRLHVWRPGLSPAAGHIHNHRFHLVSTLVCGAADKHIFVRDESGTATAEYREAFDDEEWRLERIGVTALRVSSLTRLTAGDQYVLPADALHRFTADPGRLTATLLLETKPVRRNTEVFTEPTEAVPHRISKPRLTVEAYRRALGGLVTELA